MLSPEVRRAKVDGVRARLKQAREVYGREAAKCAELLTLLQADCPHTIQHEEGRPRGSVIKCSACDYSMSGQGSNN